MLLLATVLAHDGRTRWVLVALGAVALASSLIFLQPSFSPAFTLAVTALVILLRAGQQRFWVLTVYGLGVLVFACLILQNPTRLVRLLAFFSGDKPHVANCWLPWEAIKSGGWLGQGFGQSMTMQYYRSEATGDFITVVIGEELGWFALLVIALSLILLVAVGLLVSQRVLDRFGRLLGFGICALIAVQAAVHFAVVFHWLSIHGVALPFVSHGGLGLIVMLGLVGILLNMARSATPHCLATRQALSTRRSGPTSSASA